MELHLTDTRLLDLRDPAHCAAFGIDPMLAAVPWLPQRTDGHPASSWEVSDRARGSGADGMIYTARSEPTRWHVVLFTWPMARLTGRVLPYPIPAPSPETDPARRNDVPAEPPLAGVTEP